VLKRLAQPCQPVEVFNDWNLTKIDHISSLAFCSPVKLQWVQKRIFLAFGSTERGDYKSSRIM